MHKIDGPGHVGGQFVSEDAATGRAPTVVTPEWLNAVQGELAALVAAAGLALDKSNSAQVLAALKMIFGDGPGAVSFFARSTAPVGYLKANGAAISRTAYAALFASVGTTFGVGDGATTFNLPDLRGEFLRGFDDGRGVDVGRTLGTFQDHGLQKHIHELPTGSGSPGSDGFWGVNDMYWMQSNFAQGFNGTPANQTFAFTADSSAGIAAGYSTLGMTRGNFGHETRPRNLALLACIKY